MIRPTLFSALALLCGTGSACLAAEPVKVPAGSRPQSAELGTPAEPARISSKVVVEPGRAPTDQESRELSFAACRILKHVAQARAALSAGNNDQALVHVDQGLKLMAIIDSVLPRHKMKTSISSGDLVYSDEDEFSPEFITIFEELERRDVVSPVLRAKREAAQKTAADAAGGEAAPGKDPGFYFSQADIDYTSLKLDVDLTLRLLHAAKKSLGDADPNQADLQLANIQTLAVLVEYDEIDVPLEQAADNLKLAEAEMKAGRHDAAKAALNAAIDELEKYEKQTGETRSKDVRALHKEIRELTQELDKGRLSPEESQQRASRISEWWSRATKWFRNR